MGGGDKKGGWDQEGRTSWCAVSGVPAYSMCAAVFPISCVKTHLTTVYGLFWLRGGLYATWLLAAALSKMHSTMHLSPL
jgi:hypothetical protein